MKADVIHPKPVQARRDEGWLESCWRSRLRSGSEFQGFVRVAEDRTFRISSKVLTILVLVVQMHLLKSLWTQVAACSIDSSFSFPEMRELEGKCM